MNTENKEVFASPWKHLASTWEKYYTPPGRPSIQDQEIYGALLEQVAETSGKNALVLGATPETRNVLHSLGFDVTIIDINQEMIHAMNSFVNDADQDTQICGSWVSNDLPDNTFDAVLGDFSWSNIPRKDWPEFHTTLLRVLKSSGSYIHRVHKVPDNWPFRDTQIIFEDFSKRTYTHQLAFELFFELLTNSYDAETKDVSMQRVWQLVSPFWEKGEWKQEEIPNISTLLTHLYTFWGDLEKKWDIGYEQDLRNDIDPYFIIEDVVHATDYAYSNVTPFWYCKKK